MYELIYEKAEPRIRTLLLPGRMKRKEFFLIVD